jgi:WD40 repeat protein
MGTNDKAQELTPVDAFPQQVSAAEDKTPSDDSKTLADSPAPDGSQRRSVSIPDHELLSCVGRGSYGEVWLGRNVMGTYRAVKLVYRAAFEHARPFEREFNGIQKFEPISRSHDGFVDVLQIGRTDDYFYYVMELADDVITGQQIDPATYEPKTLRSQVQAQKALPFEQCIELALSLTAALGHLHGHGLIHRDIKPSNIIFVNGIPKLADIGLVAEQSEAKSFVGTEGFIPPEGPGTPQADIYSLGKVLYEMATGKDRHEFPALPTLLGKDAEDTQLVELNSVMLKACQNTVPLRYQSCQQMRQDLLLLQSGKSVKRAQALERRLSLLTRVGFLGASVAIVAVAAFFYVNGLRLRAARAEQERTRQLYVSHMAIADKEVREGNIRRALEALDAHQPKPGGAPPAFEYAYLRQLCEGGQFFKFPAQDRGVFALVYSPDGKFLATGNSFGEDRDFSGELKVFDLDSKKEVEPFPVDDGVRSLAWSTNGEFLAAGMAGSTVHLWNARTRKVLKSFFNKEGQTVTVQFTPDSQCLAAAFLEPVYKTNERIVLWDLQTFQERVVEVLAMPPAAFAFSPNGQWLAYGGVLSNETPVLCLWDLPAHRQISQVPLPWSGGILAASFSPDSKTLAYGTRTGGVALWDLSKKIQALGKHHDAVLSVCFDSTGGLLATSSADGTIKLWQPIEGKEVQMLCGHTNSVEQVAFSPDGTQLASASTDKTVRLWSPGRSDRDVLRGHTREVTSLAFSRADGRLASASLDRTVRIWDLHGRSQPDVLSGFTNDVLCVAFSPDGRYLVAGGNECSIRIFEMATPPRRIKTLAGKGDQLAWNVDNAQFSKDGKYLFFEQPLIYVYETGSWRFVDVLPATGDNPVTKIAVSPDNRVLAMGGNPGVRLYEMGSWRPRGPPLTGHSGRIGSLEFAGNDQIVYGSTDGNLFIWNLKGSGQPTRLTGQVGKIGALAVSIDAKTLAVGDMTGSIKLRNMATGQELFALDGHETAVNALVYSPDGKLLASGGSDGTIRLWRTESSTNGEVPGLQVRNDQANPK